MWIISKQTVKVRFSNFTLPVRWQVRLTQLPGCWQDLPDSNNRKRVFITLSKGGIMSISIFEASPGASLCHTERCNENQLILELQQVLLQWRILSRRNPNLLLWREIPLTSSMAISKSALDVTGGQLLLFSRNVHSIHSLEKTVPNKDQCFWYQNL